MRRLLGGDDFDTVAATLDFVAVCQGDYARSARTVWRVDGDGQPPPYVNVFEWGGHFFGVPNIRIWFVQQGSEAPGGIGAFLENAGDRFPEKSDIETRLAVLLQAPACYLVSD